MEAAEDDDPPLRVLREVAEGADFFFVCDRSNSDVDWLVILSLSN